MSSLSSSLNKDVQSKQQIQNMLFGKLLVGQCFSNAPIGFTQELFHNGRGFPLRGASTSRENHKNSPQTKHRNKHLWEVMGGNGQGTKLPHILTPEALFASS